jgi:hypothetical protein
MPMPTLTDVHVNRPLTNVSIAFMQQPSSFVAAQAVPVIPVQNKSDTFFTYDRSYWFRNEMGVRAPGNPGNVAGYDLSTDSYSCDEFVLSKDVDDSIRANCDPAVDMDRDAAQFLSMQAMINMESQFMSALYTTGLWTGSTTATDITPATKWDVAGSDPVIDIKGQMRSIKSKTGYKPNLFVISSRCWAEGIEANAAVMDRIRYTQRAIVTEEIFASILGVDKVIVAEGVQNTAAEGAVAVYTNMGTATDACLYYVEKSPGLMKPSAFYAFSWQGLLGAGNLGQRILRKRDDLNFSDRITIQQAFDMKLVAADLGCYFSAAIT